MRSQTAGFLLAYQLNPSDGPLQIDLSGPPRLLDLAALPEIPDAEISHKRIRFIPPA